MKIPETPKKEPEKQPRDHAVKCVKLCGRETWNHDAICNGCRNED